MFIHPLHRPLAWGLAAALALVTGGAMAAQAPSFSITSPVSGATVTSPVSLVVAVQGAKIGQPIDGLDHLHVAVDGGPVMPVYKPGPLKLPLAAGKHTVEVELAGPTHQPLAPPKSVTFTVK